MDQSETFQILTSSPILFASASTLSPIAQLCVAKEPDMKNNTVARDFFSEWLCINDTVGSPFNWVKNIIHVSSRWVFKLMFTSRRDWSLSQLFYPYFESQYRGLESLISANNLKNVSVLDITYIKMDEGNLF